MAAGGREQVLVVGGGTFLGDHIAAALQAEGVPVAMLVRPGSEDMLGPLAEEITWAHGDPWNAASLKGRGRNARLVIHAVGGIQADKSQGINHHSLNFLSLRNVANMCVTAGVPRMVYISAARAPWLPRSYIRAKREAERYMARVGLRATVIRSPLLYRRGDPRPLSYRLMNLLATVTPFFRRTAPLPVDVFARGIARLVAADERDRRSIYYAADLRRLNTPEERRGEQVAVPSALMLEEPPLNEADTQPGAPVG